VGTAGWVCGCGGSRRSDAQIGLCDKSVRLYFTCSFRFGMGTGWAVVDQSAFPLHAVLSARQSIRACTARGWGRSGREPWTVVVSPW